MLKATIDEFITSNQPVGSKLLKEQYTFKFSPATIRNILSKLEKMFHICPPQVFPSRFLTENEVNTCYHKDLENDFTVVFFFFVCMCVQNCADAHLMT